jgi:hypothetical protein
MAICNITAENDADFYRSFSYQTIEGAPIDLTNCPMVMKLRKQAFDVAALEMLSTDTGEIVVDPLVVGRFTLWLTQDRLVRLQTGDYAQSLIATINAIKVKIWSGVFTITAGPSR